MRPNFAHTSATTVIRHSQETVYLRTHIREISHQYDKLCDITQDLKYIWDFILERDPERPHFNAVSVIRHSYKNAILKPM